MKARLVNWWRKRFPHPAAITRREESRRAKESRAKRDAADRTRFLMLGRAMLADREGFGG